MDLVGLLLRAVLVFGLLGLTLWAVRRVDRGRASVRSGAPVQVLSTTRLGKGASLALVRIGDSAYALGVTEHQVQLLTTTELPEGAAATVPAAAAGAAGAAAASDAAAASGAVVGPPSFAAALQTQVGLLVRPRRPVADEALDAHAGS